MTEIIGSVAQPIIEGNPSAAAALLRNFRPGVEPIRSVVEMLGMQSRSTFSTGLEKSDKIRQIPGWFVQLDFQCGAIAVANAMLAMENRIDADDIWGIMQRQLDRSHAAVSPGGVGARKGAGVTFQDIYEVLGYSSSVSFISYQSEDSRI